MKEIVENAIDANANLVEIKLKEYGEESIEVSDNGCGVEENNFEGLSKKQTLTRSISFPLPHRESLLTYILSFNFTAAKYHTSKLRQFSDLESVPTFGFRGEALSSLCAVSKMTIITRHKTATYGTKLEINSRGEIVKKSPIARQEGTTVIIQNLFANLPVRKIEFHRNIKKEFMKMSSIVQAYGLIADKCRIICSNQSSKGVKTVILNTSGGKGMHDNIINIFGNKQMADLTEVKPVFEESSKDIFDSSDIRQDIESLEEKGIDRLNLSRFKINGWISKCHHGCGRSSKDRQFFFVNSRPVEPKNVMKLVNDIYHKYNVNQVPFVCLNLDISRVDVDINLTPDKRQVLINNESVLLLAIKISLTKTFEGMVSHFKLDTSTILNMKNMTTKDAIAEENEFKSDSKSYGRMLTQWKKTGDTAKTCKEVPTKRKHHDELATITTKLRKMQDLLEDGNASTSNQSYKTLSDEDDEKTSVTINCKTPRPECNLETTESSSHASKNKVIEKRTESETGRYKIDCKVDGPRQLKITQEKPRESFERPTAVKPVQERNLTVIVEDSVINKTDTLPSSKSSTKLKRSKIKLKISVSNIREKVMREDKLIRDLYETESTLKKLKFKSKIEPSANKAAEDELSREITKNSFKQMQIVGQFNLGFIVVRLGDDLFIIDQHASDEKYNFETLQKTTVLQHQKLCIPQSLELTAAKEILLKDHLEMFKLNGFVFDIDEDAPSTRRVKLVSKPFSQKWEFGKEDIDELLFMLEDAPPNTVCRPSRVRAMFASRACRKSVMIGSALNMRSMRKLVDHMGEMDHPWVECVR